MKTLIAILFSALTAAAQVELSGGLEVSGGVTLGQEAAPAGEGSPGLLTSGWNTNRVSQPTLTVTNLAVSGSGKLIMACIGWYQAGVTISSVTFGDQNFTEQFATNFYNSTGKSSVWSLVAPDTETTNVTVTWSGDVGEGSLSVLVITNAKQSGTFGTWVVNDQSSAQQFFTNAVSGDVGDFCYSDIAHDGVSSTYTNNSDETFVHWAESNPSRVCPGSAYKIFDATTEYSVWNWAAPGEYATHFSVAIKKP